jgi:hypothetical protein
MSANIQYPVSLFLSKCTICSSSKQYGPYTRPSHQSATHTWTQHLMSLTVHAASYNVFMWQPLPHPFLTLYAEWNPSTNSSLPRFLSGDFDFKCLLLKKTYLVDFSLKFKEIKFCTPFMNWLIREKMFAYFYNKVRPMNCIHFIKCDVNHYSHNSGCCRRSVAHWIPVLSQHTVFKIGVIYKFTLVWYSMKQGTTHRPTSHLAHL